MVQWLRLQFSMHRVRLQSLLGKLRSPVTQWSKHQNINGSNTVTNSINNLKKKKKVHIKKNHYHGTGYFSLSVLGPLSCDQPREQERVGRIWIRNAQGAQASSGYTLYTKAGGQTYGHSPWDLHPYRMEEDLPKEKLSVS